ncbi:MAG: hypothetical protein Q4P16_01225 [Spirochaetales bacterium]|nr:hypothetical protein [Spirochaetales bacterium]
MRKFAKISAVLAAMVLALAFAGCKSDDDDDDVSSSTLGISGAEKAYWISVEEKDDGSVKYAKSYIEFTSGTTAKSYKYYDQNDVDIKEEAPSVGYFLDTEVSFKTSGNTLTVTDGKFSRYEKGVWVYENFNDSSDLTDWSLTYTISGSEMTEVFTFTSKGETDSETTKYTKVASKPTEPYKK